MSGLSTRLGNWTSVLIQVLLWSVFYLLLLLYSIHKWNQPIYAVLNASIGLFSYMAVIYAHAFWLLPTLLFRGRRIAYFIGSFVFVTGIILLRMAVEKAVLIPLHRSLYQWNWAHFSFTCVTVLIAFLFGALLRVALNYMQLLQWKKEQQQKQAEAELKLLKAQVQPHFLFNTLNNIYALAQSRSHQTPDMIARLSELMRYFIEEAPKEKVCLAAELSFIQSYIELEQIRMVHPISLTFTIDKDLNDLRLPPMLLMPFVENVFKHGIDKLQTKNELTIQISKKNGMLKYSVCNTLPEYPMKVAGGFGLQNLQKRLLLLYADTFSLHTQKTAHTFNAELIIPVNEN